MHGRGARAWITLCVLLSLLLPAVASPAGTADELGQKKAALRELQAEIARHEAEAGSLEEQIDALNDNLIRLRKELARLAGEIKKIESAVRSAQARIDATQAEIDKIQKIATRQAISLYKAGTTETLDALLNARSLTELDNRVEMLGVAAQKNTGALIKMGRLQVEIKAAHRELFNEKEKLQAAHDRQSSVLATMDKQHAKLAERLARKEAELGEEHAHEGSLENAIRSIESKILEKTTLHSVAILGKSSQGYIWPLNGPITSYYGPRWGRMHTGIDINGSTGQPVVASKSGTVILASSYSGYGYAVIINHGHTQTLYAHLSAFQVSEGQQISQGKIIGAVGCTGSCTGDHLHFEVRVNGSPTDPLNYLP